MTTKTAVRASNSFDAWYWSYGYASKAVCIKFVENSDLTKEEKEKLIEYHRNNLGKHSPDSNELHDGGIGNSGVVGEI